jgi:hypothetical protein
MSSLVESLDLSRRYIFPEIVRKEKLVYTFRTGAALLPFALGLPLVFLQALQKLLLDLSLSGQGGLTIKVQGDEVVFRSLQLSLVDQLK